MALYLGSEGGIGRGRLHPECRTDRTQARQIQRRPGEGQDSLPQGGVVAWDGIVDLRQTTAGGNGSWLS
ncbi:MAG: hypothetical protein ACJ8FD_24700, partial [Bradyrhizobium canariense]